MKLNTFNSFKIINNFVMPLRLCEKNKRYVPITKRQTWVNESIRSLVRETTLSPSDFMFPMFIAEGENVKLETFNES
jgi:hypothetical protein